MATPWSPSRETVNTMQVGTDQENSGPRTPLERRTKLTPTSPADRVKVTPLEPRSPKRDNRTDGPLARAADHIGHAPHPIGQRPEKNIKKATDSVTKGLSGHTGHTGPTVDSKG